MLKIYNCIATAHDLRLVILAAIVCALSSFAAFRLLHHARTVHGQMRYIWLAVSAVSIGFGIWATHFIAMLAFSPGIQSGYNIALTALSLAAAILLTGGGLAVAMIPSWSAAPALGGAIVAGGIAAMHYTGMAAFEIAGIIVWDFAMVTWSIVLGAVLGAVALPIGLHESSEKWKAAGAVLLTLAICSHHFTAMAAVTILPDPAMSVPDSALPPALLAILVCAASLTIILLSLGAVALDLRDRRRAELETDRMRGLANAAVEGLLVCDGDTIVTVNDSFAQLTGSSSAALVGSKLDRCLPDEATRSKLFASPNQPMEVTLLDQSGAGIPAEVILRPIDYAGRPHHVIAVRDLRARKKNEQHIRYLAHHDALTSLPNRTSFNAAIDQALEVLPKNQKLAVLCLDLDRFKEVNDLFGHAAGDKVLQTVAIRIGALLGNGQIMSRLGGDEFAIRLPNAADAQSARRFAESVLGALRVKGDTPETDSISSSIGIALYPDDASDRQMLLNHADTALYRAKTEGRNTYRFFEARMGEEVRERRMIEHDLRHAVARHELRLVYQPQHDIKTNTVTGFEALLRWKHPTRGDVSPATFIPIAEEAGAILGIGEWVLRTACREAASWPEPLTVAVNVSTLQIYDPHFAQLVHSILLETGLPPGQLELEITETALVRDLNRALLTLRQIKALGVHIAMDDFGTGYSSLSNLRAFPFDKIKIDGSFIKSVDHNEQAATIVRTVLGLGRGLGLPVLAEGVETVGEMKFLRDQNCDEIQGYLIGRPSDIEDFRAFTHNEAPSDIGSSTMSAAKAG